MDSGIAYELREAAVDLLKVSLLDLEAEYRVWYPHVQETTHQSQGRLEMFWDYQILDPLAMNFYEIAAEIRQRENQTMTPQQQNLTRRGCRRT